MNIDREGYITRAIKHRLVRNSKVRPEKIDEIMKYAQSNLTVRMTKNGWAVIETDIQKFFADVMKRPGWVMSVVGEPGPTPYQRLIDANRKADEARRRSKTEH